MIGIICNVVCVALGGVIGALMGNRLSDSFVKSLNSIFGICSLGMGISSIILMENMPAVIMAVIVGTAIGLAIHLGDLISNFGLFLQKLINKEEEKHEQTQSSHIDAASSESFSSAAASGSPSDLSGSSGRRLDVSLFVTAMVLFCSSGTGIYGSLDAGMTGSVTILLSKSILDFFTAIIFACSLGPITSIIAVPQFIIFGLLFLLAGVIYPLTTPVMINDFKACGGFILLATGLRIAKVKEFPIADMLPAMLIVMPISYVWVTYIIPLL